MRFNLLGMSALALAAVSAPAFAQDAAAPASDFTVTGGATLVSDYRFRGISQTDKRFAVQGTLTVSHSSGFYATVWGSSIDDYIANGSDQEIDLIAARCDIFVDRGAPGADIEAGFMCDGEAALKGEALVGLRNAAEAIVADDSRAAGDGDCRSRFVLRESRSRDSRQRESRHAKDGEAHGVIFPFLFQITPLHQQRRASLFWRTRLAIRHAVFALQHWRRESVNRLTSSKDVHCCICATLIAYKMSKQ